MASPSPSNTIHPVPIPGLGLHTVRDWATAASDNALVLLFLVPSITCFLWFFVSYHTSPLKQYPGPFLAGQ